MQMLSIWWCWWLTRIWTNLICVFRFLSPGLMQPFATDLIHT
jgi:hypothetical protein